MKDTVLILQDRNDVQITIQASTRLTLRTAMNKKLMNLNLNVFEIIFDLTVASVEIVY